MLKKCEITPLLAAAEDEKQLHETIYKGWWNIITVKDVDDIQADIPRPLVNECKACIDSIALSVRHGSDKPVLIACHAMNTANPVKTVVPKNAITNVAII
jgi:hypothetical protein